MVDTEKPHKFVPRRHGSKIACEVCGGAEGNKVHDVPKRRDDAR